MRQRRLWLIGAIVLFIAAALLMHGWGPDAEPDPIVEPRFPTYPTHEEEKRQRKRARWVVPPAPEAPADTPEVRLDPLFVALSRPSGVVLEASAVLHSEVGQAVYACFAAQADFPDTLATFERKAGFSINDLDRVAFDGDVVVVSALRRQVPELEGDWEILSPESRIAEQDEQTVGLFGDDMLLLGPAEQVKAALTRLEHRQPPEHTLPTTIAYGEIYGRAGSQLLEKLLDTGEQDRTTELREAIDSVEFHFDIQRDVAMYFSVRGEDADKLDAVAKSIAGALSLARINAELRGDNQLKQLLSYTRISDRSHDYFALEVVLPKAFVLERFSECQPGGRHPPVRGEAPDAGTSDVGR